jgi:hypothetical protein
MSHCDGRLFDGSACNTDLVGCADCGATGCTGDGCDFQTWSDGACACGATSTAGSLVGAAA